ncbi:MAG: hypothetical protein AB7O96_17315, partial [Pseudobdellovibrionaceae bacterium]
LIHSDPLGHVIPHDAIQAKMRQIIEEKVKSENANLSEFQLQSLWTEEVDKDAVKVHYSYSFVNPSSEGSEATRQSRAGVALLKQAADNATNWSIEKQEGSTDSIEFSDALVISPNEKAEAQTEAPATSEAPLANPEAAPSHQ